MNEPQPPFEVLIPNDYIEKCDITNDPLTWASANDAAIYRFRDANNRLFRMEGERELGPREPLMAVTDEYRWEGQIKSWTKIPIEWAGKCHLEMRNLGALVHFRRPAYLVEIEQPEPERGQGITPLPIGHCIDPETMRLYDQLPQPESTRCPVNLREQLLSEARARCGIMSSAKNRQAFDAAFEEFWEKVEAYFSTPEIGQSPSTGGEEKPRITFYELRHYMFSNFSSFAVVFDGRLWMTSEHAYQAMKFTDRDTQELIRDQRSAHQAMKLAQSMEAQYRPDWPTFKLVVMEDICRHKLQQHPYIQKKLAETGKAELIESSPIDSFWGWGPNKDGENHLGKIWMKLRTELPIASLIPPPASPATPGVLDLPVTEGDRRAAVAYEKGFTAGQASPATGSSTPETDAPTPDVLWEVLVEESTKFRGSHVTTRWNEIAQKLKDAYAIILTQLTEARRERDEKARVLAVITNDRDALRESVKLRHEKYEELKEKAKQTAKDFETAFRLVRQENDQATALLAEMRKERDALSDSNAGLRSALEELDAMPCRNEDEISLYVRESYHVIATALKDNPKHATSATLSAAQARAQALEKQVQELTRKVFMPGDWHCDVCGFEQHNRTLHMSDGSVSAPTIEEVMICPNKDGSVMRRITWEEASRANYDACQRFLDERDEARKRYDAARALAISPEELDRRVTAYLAAEEAKKAQELAILPGPPEEGTSDEERLGY